MCWNIFFDPWGLSSFDSNASKRELEILLKSVRSENTAADDLNLAFCIGREINLKEVQDAQHKRLDLKIDLLSKVQKVLQRKLSEDESISIDRLSEILNTALNTTFIESLLSRFYYSDRQSLAKQLQNSIGLSEAKAPETWRQSSQLNNIIVLIEGAICRSLRDDEKSRIAVLCKMFDASKNNSDDDYANYVTS